MSNIFIKEVKLSASILAYLFTAFGAMFLLPGYPVLCGAFFVTLGIFQSFQYAREANDILFSALLPIAKKDVVRGRFLFVCFIEMCGFAVMAAAALLRMTVFSAAAVYRNNALMNANLFALGMALVIFGLFNLIFVRGYFKTAYKFAGPFVKYIIAAFAAIIIAEALHYFPGLAALNAFGFENALLQLGLLAAGGGIYAAMTLMACKTACRTFETIDL